MGTVPGHGSLVLQGSTDTGLRKARQAESSNAICSSSPRLRTHITLRLCRPSSPHVTEQCCQGPVHHLIQHSVHILVYICCQGFAYQLIQHSVHILAYIRCQGPVHHLIQHSVHILLYICQGPVHHLIQHYYCALVVRAQFIT